MQSLRIIWTESNNKTRQFLENWQFSQFSNSTTKVPVKKTSRNNQFQKDIAEHTSAEHSVLIKILTTLLIGLDFKRHNGVVINTTHSLIRFPHLTMLVKSAASETIAKPQAVVTNDALTKPPKTPKTYTAVAGHPSEWNTTSTVTPLKKFPDAANLMFYQSMSTINDKKVAVRLTNTTNSFYLIKKITQIAEIPVVTPEQSKVIKPVDTAILYDPARCSGTGYLPQWAA